MAETAERMTSRERVSAAINHREPDRVPIDLGGSIVTGIMAMPYARFKSYLGISEGEIRVIDWKQQLAAVEEPVLERIGGDVVPSLKYARKWDLIKDWRDSVLPDGTPCRIPADFNPERLGDGSLVVKDETGTPLARMPRDGFYFDDVWHPLESASSFDDIERYPWPYEVDRDVLEELRTGIRSLREKSDYFVIESGFFPSIYEMSQVLRGWGNFMVDLASNPRFACYLMDKLVEVNIERFKQYIEYVEDPPEVILVGDDLGMETGTQISPEMYRKMVKPRQKKLYDFIKSRADVKLLLHSCGSVYDLIPDFIEIGIDILNPVQVSAAKMDTADLKKRFGDDLVFWGGGCDTQKVLPFGTPDEVRDEVKRRTEDLAPGGGFVFTQVHNIQAGVPPENIAAMYEALDEYSWY